MNDPSLDTFLRGFGSVSAVITDGAWGTQLQARGLSVGGCSEEWNLSRPGQVEEVARGYVAAGSRVILTNTFGGNRFVLESHGLGDRWREINRLGVEISRRAAEGRALVFASIGPSGKLLMTGEVGEDELRGRFEEQVDALGEAGPDGFVVETMTDLEEAVIAVAAAARTGLPVVGCMTFGAGKSKDRTIMGVTPEQAAKALLEAGAALAGANCGTGGADYVPVCRRLREASGRPVWLKPNAGLPEVIHGQVVYSTGPDEFAEQCARLVEAGALFIGGCCGSNPAFIQAMVNRLDSSHERGS